MALVGAFFEVERNSAAHRAKANSDLIVATKANNVSAVQVLLGHNRAQWSWTVMKTVDVNGTDEDGWSALHYACSRGFVEVAEALLAADDEYSCDPESRTPDGLSPLMLAAREGQLACVQLMLPVSSPDSKDDDGWSALMHAVASSEFEITQCLIQVAADVNTVASPSQHTPLALAVHSDNTPIMEILLQARADVFKAGRQEGYPILMYISSNRANGQMLLRHGIRLHNSRDFDDAAKCFSQASAFTCPYRPEAQPTEGIDHVYCLSQLGAAAVKTQTADASEAASALHALREAFEEDAEAYFCVSSLILAKLYLDMSEHEISVSLLNDALAFQQTSAGTDWLPIDDLLKYGADGWWHSVWMGLGRSGGVRTLDTLILLGDAHAALNQHSESASTYMKALQLRSAQLTSNGQDSREHIAAADVDELCAVLLRAGSAMWHVSTLAAHGISMLQRAVSLQNDREPTHELNLALAMATLEECLSTAPVQSEPAAGEEEEPVSPASPGNGFDELIRVCNADVSTWEEKHRSALAVVHATFPPPGNVLVRAELTLPNVPASVVLSLLLDHKSRTKWDGLFVTVKELQPTETASNGDELHYIHLRMKKQLAIAPRDLCMRWRVRRVEEMEGAGPEGAEPRLACTILMEDMEHEGAPKQKGWERVQSFVSGYQIMCTEGGESSVVVSVNQSDVGGNVPVRITNAFAAKAPVEWAKKLNKACLKLMKNKKL